MEINPSKQETSFRPAPLRQVAVHGLGLDHLQRVDIGPVSSIAIAALCLGSEL